MQKLLIILFMTIYFSGILLFPAGDISYAANIAGIYDHCKDEDPDINPADFIFEHLLNVPEFSEHGEREENERPHQPVQQIVSGQQVVVEVSKPITFECNPPIFSIQTIQYRLLGKTNIKSGYLSEIFHPPIV